MFLCEGSIGYGHDEKIKKLSDEQYDTLRAGVTSKLAPCLPAKHEDFEKIDRWQETIMDDVEVEAWTRAEIDVTMKTIKGLSRGYAAPAGSPAQHVTQISLANVGLLEIEQVSYEEDCCTDHLQDMLNEGWRILCVCPPKDSRRPTYILGRRDKR